MCQLREGEISSSWWRRGQARAAPSPALLSVLVTGFSWLSKRNNDDCGGGLLFILYMLYVLTGLFDLVSNHKGNILKKKVVNSPGVYKVKNKKNGSFSPAPHACVYIHEYTVACILLESFSMHPRAYQCVYTHLCPYLNSGITLPAVLQFPLCRFPLVCHGHAPSPQYFQVTLCFERQDFREWGSLCLIAPLGMGIRVVSPFLPINMAIVSRLRCVALRLGAGPSWGSLPRCRDARSKGVWAPGFGASNPVFWSRWSVSSGLTRIESRFGFHQGGQSSGTRSPRAWTELVNEHDASPRCFTLSQTLCC